MTSIVDDEQARVKDELKPAAAASLGAWSARLQRTGRPGAVAEPDARLWPARRLRSAVPASEEVTHASVLRENLGEGFPAATAMPYLWQNCTHAHAKYRHGVRQALRV